MKTFKKSFLMKFLSLMFAFLMVFSFSVNPAFADPDDDLPSAEDVDSASGGGGGSQKDSDISYYKIASAAATYYEELHNPKYKNKKSSGKGAIANISMNNASSLMGFKDEDYDSWIIGATVSKLSASAQGRGYNAEQQGVQAYLIYGNALSQLGLDKTANANLNAVSSIGRGIFGAIFIIAYTIANVADMIMQGCLDVMMMLNPFSLFMGAGGITSKVGTINGYNNGVMLGLTSLQKTLSKFYKDCQDFAWIIIPFMFVYLLWGFLMKPSYKSPENSGKNRSNLRKYVTRVFFIGLGVPVLASALALSYKAFEDIKDGEGFNPNGIVAMTFMDFETWVRQSRLGLPGNAKIQVDTSIIPSGTIESWTTDPKYIAFGLNQHVSKRTSNSKNFFSEDARSDERTGWGSDRKEQTRNAYDLMNRFRSGAFYEAAAYESDVKNSAGPGSYKKLTEKDIKLLGDRKNWHKSGKISLATNGNTIVSDGSPSYLQYSKSGSGMWLFSGSSPSLDPSSSSSSDSYKPSWSSLSRVSVGDGGGLSTLGMYNYLNTTFSPSSVVVYSANKASSIVIRDAHRSVSLVGQGVMGALNYLNGLSLLSFVSVLAVGFGLAMMIANLKRTVRLITAIPLSVLGSLKMMARLTTIVFMMIIEIFGTLFSYIIMLELIFGINTTIMNAFQNLFSKLNFSLAIGLTPVNAVMAPVLIGTLVTTIINVWITIMALRVRKSMIKAADEWMAGLVERFFVTPDVGQSTVASDTGNKQAGQKQPGVIGRGVGGLASGAGMMAGMRATNGLFDKISNKSDGVSGVTGGAENVSGDEKVTAADAGSEVEGSDRQVHGSEGAENGQLALDDSSRGQLMLASGASNLDDISSTRSVRSSSSEDSVDRKQAKADSNLQTVTGNTGAVEEEKDRERVKEIKKDAKAQQAQAGTKATVGAAEAVVGAKTGNAEMTADGAKRVVAAADSNKKAVAAKKNASGEVAQQRVNENKIKKTVGGQQAINQRKEADKSFSNQMAQQKSVAVADSNRKKSVRNAGVHEVTDAGMRSVGSVKSGVSTSSPSAYQAGGMGQSKGTNINRSTPTTKPVSATSDKGTSANRSISTTKPVSATQDRRNTQGQVSSNAGNKTFDSNTSQSAKSDNKGTTIKQPQVSNDVTRQRPTGKASSENRPVRQSNQNIAAGNTSMKNTNVINQAGSHFVSRGKNNDDISQRDFQANVRESQRQMAGQIAKMKQKERNESLSSNRSISTSQGLDENRHFEKDKKDFQQRENHESNE